MSTVCASYETVIIDQMAREIARLVRDGTGNTDFSLVDYGTVERLAFMDDITNVLPGCFVRPGTDSIYESADITGQLSAVTESVRIQVAVPFNESEDPFEKASDKVKLVVDAIKADRSLSEIANDISPHQISQTNLEAVEWDGFEDQFLRQQGIPVKVVVVRWGFRWLTRGP